MNIGIYTYGTRGDLQPYIALALGLISKGHTVTVSATEDFSELVEGFGVPFEPLWGNAESVMNSEEGQAVLRTGNPIRLMKYYFKLLHDNRAALRRSYHAAISKVDVIIANLMTLPIVSAIAEAQGKKMVLTYFMPPLVPTKEFPASGLDLFDFPLYNKLTYMIAQGAFWQIIKRDTNEYRKELGLPGLKGNLLTHLGRQHLPELYCISQSLIPRPKDWQSHQKITGFIHIPKARREHHPLDQAPPGLNEWLAAGSTPIYIGFGSNGVAPPERFTALLTDVLNKTDERILFCTGWSVFDKLPRHPHLFVTKYINHETILRRCKLGVFHGGAGTLAAMMRNGLPVIIVSFYTDQPTWGKIVERKKLGFHIPVKKLTSARLIAAIVKCQSREIKRNVAVIGDLIADEKGLDNAIYEIERFFNS